MKIGDLVRRNGVQARAEVGIIVAIEASETHYQICWANGGIYWNPAFGLELVNASR